MKNKFYTCKNDRAMKYILLNKNNWDILEAILEEVIGKKLKVIEVRNFDLLKEKNYKKYYLKAQSIIVKKSDSDSVMEIVLNSRKKDFNRKEDVLYPFKAFQQYAIKVNGEYKYLEKVYMIDLAYGLDSDYKTKEKYLFQNEKGEILTENFEIDLINMSKIINMYEDNNNESKKYKYLIMLDLDDNSLENYLKNDSIAEKYKKEIKKLNNDPNFRNLVSYDEN